MEQVDGIYYPTNEEFLNKNCIHNSKVMMQTIVNDKHYIVLFCSDCLRLLEKHEIRANRV